MKPLIAFDFVRPQRDEVKCNQKVDSVCEHPPRDMSSSETGHCYGEIDVYSLRFPSPPGATDRYSSQPSLRLYQAPCTWLPECGGGGGGGGGNVWWWNYHCRRRTLTVDLEERQIGRPGPQRPPDPAGYDQRGVLRQNVQVPRGPRAQRPSVLKAQGKLSSGTS
eukprot:gene17481-biopygen567